MARASGLLKAPQLHLICNIWKPTFERASSIIFCTRLLKSYYNSSSCESRIKRVLHNITLNGKPTPVGVCFPWATSFQLGTILPPPCPQGMFGNAYRYFWLSEQRQRKFAPKILWGEARKAAKHPTVHKTVPCNKELPNPKRPWCCFSETLPWTNWLCSPIHCSSYTWARVEVSLGLLHRHSRSVSFQPYQSPLLARVSVWGHQGNAQLSIKWCFIFYSDMVLSAHSFLIRIPHGEERMGTKSHLTP